MKWIETKLAPDSYRYLAAGRGEKTYPPFNRRILLPFLCGSDERLWQLLSYSSLVSVIVLTGVYSHMNGASPEGAFFAMFLMALMPTMKFWLQTPVLTDQFGLMMALAAAILPWPLNLLTCIVGGFARESVPIFAALYAWNPVLLLGFLPVAIWSIVAPKGPDQMKRESWLDHPLQTSYAFKKGKYRDIKLWITPWGAALAGLFFPSVQLVMTMFVAYAQTIIATDAVRLYVWAAPVLILQAVQVDVMWMLPLAVSHWTNPWRGEGI